MQSKRGESKYVSNSITGENKFYKKTGGLLNRSLNLAKLRPWRTLIAMIGILVFLAALILTLGYFLAPLSAFAFMSHVFLPLTTVLSAGFAGMASSGWVIIGGVSAGLVSAISVLLFTLAPLSVVDTVNRGLTLVSDESSLANGDESSSDEDNTNFSICSLVKSLFVAQSLDNEKALKQREEIFINDPKSIGISYEM